MSRKNHKQQKRANVEKTPKEKFRTYRGYEFMAIMRENEHCPWEAMHLAKGTLPEMAECRVRELQAGYPENEVRLYRVLRQITIEPKVEAHKPRWETHPAKPMKSTARLLEDNEATAICNECGAIGPKVTKDADGEAVLYKEGWLKEEKRGEGGMMAVVFGGMRPTYTLRCPACDEAHANKGHREDWF